MFTFETGLAYIAGNLSGIMLMLILGYYLVVKRKKEAAKLNPAASKSIYNQVAGRSVRPNGERNILGDLRRLNPERCKAFGHTVESVPITFWTTAVAGETGELCNLIKKIERGDNIENAKTKIANEAADVIIYLDLLCCSLNIDLQVAIASKFNEVSDRVNSPIKL